MQGYPEMTVRVVLARLFRAVWGEKEEGAVLSPPVMDEYEELCGVEDEFESQYAAELEVLAELEGEQRRGFPWCPETLL